MWTSDMTAGTNSCSFHGLLTRDSSFKYALNVLARLDIADHLLQTKMPYAAAKESLKNALTGVGAEVQANGDDEIEYETILKVVSKGVR